MPIYEYYCSSCGTEFELRRPMSELDAPTCCPNCGAQSKRLVSAAASNVGFYLKSPAKPAFRQHTPIDDGKGKAKWPRDS